MTRLAPPALLYLLLCAPLVLTPEAVSVVAVLAIAGTIGLRGLRVPRGGVGPLLPLLAVLAIGIAGSGGHAIWDVTRDFWYLGKSVALFFAAYLLAWTIVDVRDTLRPFVAAAATAALLHVVQFAGNPTILAESIGDVRSEVGRGFLVTGIALAIFVATRRAGIAIDGLCRTTQAMIAALSVGSLVLSFSRTFVTSAAILLVVAAGGLRLLDVRRWTVATARRGIVVVAIFAAVAFGAHRMATRSVIGTDFVDKIGHSFQEMTVSDYGSRGTISQHWRGYETHRVWVHYLEGRPHELVLGRGYGAIVDTGLHMQLGEELRRYVSALHNGYADLLLKTGGLGLALYLIFFVRLIRRGLEAARDPRPDRRLAGEMLVAACLVLLATTLVISGLMNKLSMNPAVLLIGAMLAQLERSRIAERIVVERRTPTAEPLRRAS